MPLKPAPVVDDESCEFGGGCPVNPRFATAFEAGSFVSAWRRR
jgi:hypothetical protein